MRKTCLRCGSEIRLGRLCPKHAQEIATCDDFTAEQVHTKPQDTAQGWLIDPWGVAHPIAPSALVGRDPASCAISIFHHTVSSVHAQFFVEDGVWRLIDRGSLNGTFVGGVRIRECRVEHNDIIGFGEVSFYMSTVAPEEASPIVGPGRTSRSRQEDASLQITFTHEATRIELSERPGGGIAVVNGGAPLEFARLEFAVLSALSERRREARHIDLAYIPSKELAASLAFRSHDADADNVRELIRRVRKKLTNIGVTDFIQSRQGVGYRIGWDIVS